MPHSARSGSEASGSTSTSLLDRVRARDPGAWERLARLYGPLVYRWARQQGLQDADAADVCQDVFATVAARIDSFQHAAAGDSFRGWLWTITRNKLGDYLRRRAAKPPPPGGTEAQTFLQQLPDAAPTGSTDASAFDAQADLLHRALEIIRGEFEERTWLAFYRATVDGKATADIAQDLGMTPRAVRQARYRVLQRLRGKLVDRGRETGTDGTSLTAGNDRNPFCHPADSVRPVARRLRSSKPDLPSSCARRLGPFCRFAILPHIPAVPLAAATGSGKMVPGGSSRRRVYPADLLPGQRRTKVPRANPL
jgi:RNA polymerase sigma-70 factor (ECF subfamily)